MNISHTSGNGETMPDGFAGMTVLVCVILGLAFLVGAPGNLLVIWTIVRHVTERSHTVILILHLAVADLLVLITLPLWMYSLARSWVFGGAACKATVFIITACMYASVFFITVMSVERLVAICYPFTSIRWKNRRMMSKVLAVLWAAALLFSVPVLPTQTLEAHDGEEHCLNREYSSSGQEVACLLLEILAGFVVPFVILAACYGRLLSRIERLTFQSKRKSTVLIASVVVVFLLCWLPHQVGNVLSLWSIGAGDSDALEAASATTIFIAGALVFIGSSLNPLIYAFAARNFRRSLRDTGIRRLFRDISDSGTGEGAKELSGVSRRQSSRDESNKCSEASNLPLDVVQNTPEPVSS